MRARTSTPDDAKRVTMQVSTAGIVCNAALTVFKLVAGIVAHSSAMVADAVHSASDILGSLIVMIGAVFSHKAADASHPYGHEKLECIASILLGNILVLVGAAIGYAGVMKIIRGETLAALRSEHRGLRRLAAAGAYETRSREPAEIPRRRQDFPYSRRCDALLRHQRFALLPAGALHTHRTQVCHRSAGIPYGILKHKA